MVIKFLNHLLCRCGSYNKGHKIEIRLIFLCSTIEESVHIELALNMCQKNTLIIYSNYDLLQKDKMRKGVKKIG